MTHPKQTITISISPTQAKQRLDKFLGSIEPIASRTRAAELIERKLVSVNGRHTKASYVLAENDCVVVNVPDDSQKANAILQPLSLALDIVFQDEDLVVINKPAGLVVHPAAGHAQDTLVNALIHQIPRLAMGFGEHRPGIVHRLDKGTSGLMVVAKTDQAQLNLSQQFRLRQIHRLYWAVAHGRMAQARGTITSYLRRHPVERKKFASLKLVAGQEPVGKRAVTHFERIKVNPMGFTLVHCRLETGRTHQIRVHLSELGFPIVGDRLYGAPQRFASLKNEELRKNLLSLNRVALHAAELGFRHPTTEKELRFSVDWPEDLRPIIQPLEF